MRFHPSLIVIAASLSVAACETREDEAPAVPPRAEPLPSAPVSTAPPFGVPAPTIDLPKLLATALDATVEKDGAGDASALGAAVDVYLVGVLDAPDADPDSVVRSIQPWVVIAGPHASLRYRLPPALEIAGASEPAGLLVHAALLGDTVLTQTRLPSKATVLVGAAYGSGGETDGTTGFLLTHDGDALTVWSADEAWESDAASKWDPLMKIALAKDTAVRTPPVGATSRDLGALVANATALPRGTIDGTKLGSTVDASLVLVFEAPGATVDSRAAHPWLVVAGPDGAVRVELTEAFLLGSYSDQPGGSAMQELPLAKPATLDGIPDPALVTADYDADRWAVTHAPDALVVWHATGSSKNWETWATIDLAAGAHVRTPYGIVL